MPDSDDASRSHWLQRLLNDCGCATPKLTEDGRFDKRCMLALRSLQRLVGVDDDGLYGRRTAAAVLAWLST